MITPSVVTEAQCKDLSINPNQRVQLWQVIDRKNLDAPPRIVAYPNAALVERFIRGLLRSDNGNNQYATAPSDWYAAHICDFVPDRLLYILVDDDSLLEFGVFL